MKTSHVPPLEQVGGVIRKDFERVSGCKHRKPGKLSAGDVCSRLHFVLHTTLVYCFLLGVGNVGLVALK